MTWRPLPIIGEAYADEALPWSAQDVCNWIPTPAEAPGTLSPWKLETPPGYVEFSDLGTGSGIRGTHDVSGLLLAVSGNTLFRIAPDGTPTSIGTIPGVGRVSMAHNQVQNGHEVLIANGQSGYVYDTRDGTLAQITDDGFPGLKVVDFIDGYLAGVETQGRFWTHSELRKAKDWTALDRYDAEASPDKLTTLIVSSREVMVLGPESGQFFRNTGAGTGTFQNANGMEINVGCVSPFAVAQIDNTVCWLGSDGLVYALAGHTPQILSTGPIAQAMAGYKLETAFCTTWEDRKHKIVYFTFPAGPTFGYDFWTRKWHRRASHGMSRWRLNTLTRSAGKWIGGDYSNGKLYRLDWDVVTEDGEEMVSSLRSPVVHAEGNPIQVAAVKFAFDVGRVPVGDTDHYCSLRYSDDGGHNYSDARLMSLGPAGAYRTEVVERRLGRTERRVWELEVSSPAKRDLLAAVWQAEVTA